MTWEILAYGAGAVLLLLFLRNYRNLMRTAKLVSSERNQREAILNSLSDGVIEYDENSRVVLMNPAAEELLGIRFSEVRGVPITPELVRENPKTKGLVELMYPAFALYASPAKEVPGTPSKTMEVHLSSPELKLTVTLNNVVDERGNIRGFLKVLHDISREQLVGKIKSEFVSIAAHQLRTPLSAIKWTLKLLLEGDAGLLTKEQTEFLNKGYEINERMIKLVSDLLNAARIEEGRFGYDIKEMDLESFLQTAHQNSLAFAKSKSVEVKFEKREEGFPPVFADREKLSLAVNNLLDNAIKYTSPGGFVLLSLEKEKDRAVIKVTDSGAGIPPEEQKRVFSKFFRASNAIRMETEGTGLGLFIVKNIIRRHGGDISFVSEIGKGTTFTFTLPLKKELVPESETPAIEEFLASI